MLTQKMEQQLAPPSTAHVASSSSSSRPPSRPQVRPMPEFEGEAEVNRVRLGPSGSSGTHSRPSVDWSSGQTTAMSNGSDGGDRATTADTPMPESGLFPDTTDQRSHPPPATATPTPMDISLDVTSHDYCCCSEQVRAITVVKNCSTRQTGASTSAQAAIALTTTRRSHDDDLTNQSRCRCTGQGSTTANAEGIQGPRKWPRDESRAIPGAVGVLGKPKRQRGLVVTGTVRLSHPSTST